MYTFIDLFAGIGGIRLAFETLGCECVFSSEWDNKAQETYYANFGEKPLGDITAIPSDEIPHHDILLAGFPCQPFSVAGVSKKNALGRKHGFEDETQGTLFFEIARILKDKKPKAFLLENVKNLKSHDQGKTYRTIMKVLQKDLGYWTYDTVIDAKGFVPQHRERVYIVGFREQIDFSFPSMPSSGPNVKSILEDNVLDKYTLTNNLWQYLQNYADKHKEKGNGFGYGLVDLVGQTRTLSARYYKDGSEILIPQEGKNPRRLTPRECARLQGFPEEFQIVVADTAAYKQFGNSVSVPVVTKIAEAMIGALKDGKLVEGFHRGEFNFLHHKDEAIVRGLKSGKFFAKILSADDLVFNGKRPSGIQLPEETWSLLFQMGDQKNDSNRVREIRIYWEQINNSTDSIVKWSKKDSSFRLTKLGKDFPFLQNDYIGQLFILIPTNSPRDYLGYVLSESDAEVFLASFSLKPSVEYICYESKIEN